MCIFLAALLALQQTSQQAVLQAILQAVLFNQLDLVVYDPCLFGESKPSFSTGGRTALQVRAAPNRRNVEGNRARDSHSMSNYFLRVKNNYTLSR